MIIARIGVLLPVLRLQLQLQQLLVLAASITMVHSDGGGGGGGVLEGVYPDAVVTGTRTGNDNADAADASYLTLRFESVAVLDRDLELVLAQLPGEEMIQATGTQTETEDDGMAAARSVFESGSYSEPYALLTVVSENGEAEEEFGNLSVPPMSPPANGEVITGTAVDGKPPGNGGGGCPLVGVVPVHPRCVGTRPGDANRAAAPDAYRKSVPFRQPRPTNPPPPP